MISSQLVTRNLGIDPLSFGDFNMMWLIFEDDRSVEANNLSNLLEDIIALGSSSLKSGPKPSGLISLLKGKFCCCRRVPLELRFPKTHTEIHGREGGGNGIRISEWGRRKIKAKIRKDNC
jgi:hypothetical protein